jgi:TonB-linked SusC/RagA family outer membrane protein
MKCQGKVVSSHDVKPIYMKNISVKAFGVLLAFIMGMMTVSQSKVYAHDNNASSDISDTLAVGYGVQSKTDVTTAVVGLNPEDFAVGNLQDASDMIRGKVAGLSIIRDSGDPDASSVIRLRGTSSIYGDLTPLILVDGVPGDMSTVAPENIAGISVLKDAAAAAIYGTRGANGVILITTKSGKRGGGVNVTYSGYVSASDFLKRTEFMTAEDVRAGLTSFKDMGHETDWLGEISSPGFTHNNYLSVSGGAKSTTYAASVSYRGEQGVINTTGNSDLKMTFDVSQYLFKDILKLNLNLMKGIRKSSPADAAFAYRQAVTRNPTAPVFTEDASGNQVYHEEFAQYQYYNPVSILTERSSEIRLDQTRIAGNVTVEPIKGWKTNLMMATHRLTSDTEILMSKFYYPIYMQWIHSGDSSNYEGATTTELSHSVANYLDLTSQYDALWGRHRFSVIAGYSYTYDKYEEDPDQLNSADTSMYDSKLMGMFGRISYGYDDRYNVMVSYRREQHSSYGANYKWADFPSASASWNIHNERFMENVRPWISVLKLRAGWGLTGLYIPSQKQLSIDPRQTPNPDIHWETSNEVNIGIDLGFFSDRLTFAVDLYDKTTDDLVYGYSLRLSSGIWASVLANAGVMNNKGIEVMLKAIPVQTKSFEWISALTMSRNTNKLVSLSNDIYETSDYLNTGTLAGPVNVSANRVEVGKAVGGFWGLKSVGGVSENGKWIVEVPRDVTSPNGSLRYEAGQWVEYSHELNDDQYRQYLGIGVPQVTLGWGNTFRYRGLDLGVQLSSQLGFQILNTQRMFYQNNSIKYNRLKSAADALPVYDLETKQPTGESKTLSTAQVQCYISEFLERGDYVKVDNVTLGYTFNTKNSKHVKAARLYLSGDNLAVLTEYSGFDPEIACENPFWGAGIDERDKYPAIRSLTFGVNLTF